MSEVSLEHALRCLAREATNMAEEALRPLGITPHQYDILEVIASYMEEPQSYTLMPGRISAIGNFKYGWGRENVAILRREGYVRTAIGGSRLLTAAGVELLEQSRAVLRETNRIMSKYFEDTGLEYIAEAHLRQKVRS
jgi:DNA-binding MarR family transcriptional regulator